MTKTELESKHLSDLHQLAADAGVERYRMLSRAELIERLSEGDDPGSAGDSGRGRGSAAPAGDEDLERPRRRRRRSGSGSGSGGGRRSEERSEVEEEEEKQPARSARAPRPRSSAPVGEETAADSADSAEEEASSRSRRPRRRRRRFGRRREGISIQDLLLPAEAGRQVVLLAESREAATDLLRGVAGDLAAASDGPDPVALLIDPSPEELADWKREAPQAELVSAGQARHTNDALAAAQRRAGDGEDVVLLIDSLTRFAESFGDTDGAKDLFDAGRAGAAKGKGSLTVVVALERS
ncbi:MAG TPA: Rho termination factor N-terminal domain-containing protein [Solirubrobacterales bacterium]|nr:Rho termination factor N-terminal domain-containing protein [Solirubrobacterales bacterium]